MVLRRFYITENVNGQSQAVCNLYVHNLIQFRNSSYAEVESQQSPQDGNTTPATIALRCKDTETCHLQSDHSFETIETRVITGRVPTTRYTRGVYTYN